MEQEIIKSQEGAELNLEENEFKPDLSELDMEVAKYSDPRYEEEAMKKLHETVMKIEELAEQSKITLAKIFQEASKEPGLMNKLALVLRRVRDKMTATGSSTHNSLSFITSTIKALEWYRGQIPVHIANFQKGINTLKQKKVEVMATIKIIKHDLKVVNEELKKVREQIKAVGTGTTEQEMEKRELLRAKEQEILNKVQNVETKGNRNLKELEGLNNTTELFLEMKGGYEVLLKQVANLSEDLKRHKKILETIGPSVAEVRKVVVTMDKFTNMVQEYRARDNMEVRLATQAIKEITPAIQNLERPWYNKKTVEVVRKNVKDARKIYKEHWGTDITKLEDYGKDGKPKKNAAPSEPDLPEIDEVESQISKSEE